MITLNKDIKNVPAYLNTYRSLHGSLIVRFSIEDKSKVENSIVNTYEDQTKNSNTNTNNDLKNKISEITNLDRIKLEMENKILITEIETNTEKEVDTEIDNELVNKEIENSELELNNDKIEESQYTIGWSKDYKNLNFLLKRKGYNSKEEDIKHDEKFNYLVFSGTIKSTLNTKEENKYFKKDYIYSLKLLIRTARNIFENKGKDFNLYNFIISSLENNYNYIKEGGILKIYYVSSKIGTDVKESYTKDSQGCSAENISPSIERKIKLKHLNKDLIVQIFIFSYESFFKGFLKNYSSTFFKRIEENKQLWSYPILIIENLNLTTVLYLFKEAGITGSGMSITRRHKLSPLEENLSNFLYVTDLNDDVQESHYLYSDDIFSNNKLDLNLYKELFAIQDNRSKVINNLEEILKKVNKDKENLTSPRNIDVTEHYLWLKNRQLLKNNLYKMNPLAIILILRNHIFELEKEKNNLLKNQRDTLSTYEKINKEISDLYKNQHSNKSILNILHENIKIKELEKNKLEKALEDVISESKLRKIINKEKKEKRRAAVKAAKSKNQKKKIRNELMVNIEELNRKISNKQKLENELLKTKKEILEEIEEDNKKEKEIKSLETILENKSELLANTELNLVNLNKTIIKLDEELKLKQNISFSEEIKTKTKFNKENAPHKNSNKNSLKKLKSFKNNSSPTAPMAPTAKRDYSSLSPKAELFLESPIFIELKRIIDNNPATDQTQELIENFLFFQSNEIAKQNTELELRINYYRLNPFVLNYLKKHIGEITLMIDNYKTNIKLLTQIKNRKINSRDEVESKIILNLTTEKILSLLLGRMLRIISFNNFSYKNNCTQISKDLGEALMWEYFSLEHYNYKQSKIQQCSAEIVEEEESKNIQNIKNIIKKNTPNNNQSQLQKEKELKLDDNFNSLSSFILNNTELNNLKSKATDDILIQMGLRILNFLEEAKLIKTIVVQIEKIHKIHAYVITDNISEKLSNSLESLNLSNKLPMLVKPKLYSWDKINNKEKLGGFILNDVKYIEPLIIKRNDLELSSSINDLNETDKDNKIYKLVNKLSSTGFKINNQVLNFILNEGYKFDLITNFNYTHPLELKKKDRKSKFTSLERKELDSFLSKRALEKNIIGLALMYQNVSEFFIPVRIDNRGRVYCMVDYLNYQSVDLAKALLLFSKEETIKLSDSKAINYLKIYGANCFGNGIGKMSFADRIKWIEDNEDNIINFYNGVLIDKAESKLLFIAFCFEYLKYYKAKVSESHYYITNFPIKLDATCNGFQHISLLLGDLNMAEKVNLTKPNLWQEQPSDLYYYIAVKVKERLELMIKKDKLEKSNDIFNDLNWGTDPLKRNNIINSCKNLLHLKIDRKLVKTTVMVKPYNASIESRAEYLKEQFKRRWTAENKTEYFKLGDSDGIKYVSYDFTVYATIIDKVISNEFPKLNELNNYLSQIANICNKLNIPIIWTVPSGLLVKQKYMASEAIELKPFKYSKSTFKLSKIDKKINEFKQKRSLMPNLVHSLDASSLCLLVDSFCSLNLLEDRSFFAIHDCFATTINHMEDLINLLKAIYIKTYSEVSYLNNFDKCIRNNIELALGKEAFNSKTGKFYIDYFEGKALKFPDVNTVIIGKVKGEAIKSGMAGLN